VFGNRAPSSVSRLPARCYLCLHAVPGGCTLFVSCTLSPAAARCLFPVRCPCACKLFVPCTLSPARCTLYAVPAAPCTLSPAPCSLYPVFMADGFFITFEGLDGSGKSTQLRKLATHLQAKGLAVTVTRQPGGTRVGDRIRSLLLDSKTEHLDPMTELGLMFSARAQCIAEVIAPALHGGNVVLCDRFTDSTEAYQGGGRQLGSEVVLEMHRTMCAGLQPDLTLLLMADFDRSLARARRRNDRNATPQSDEGRFEREGELFHRRVYDKYLEIAAREPARVVIVEGDRSIEAISQEITALVDGKLHALGLLPTLPAATVR
jgi:dTMP kinase